MAGNREGVHEFDHRIYPWSAFRSTQFGWTKVVIHNGTHLTLEQIGVKQLHSNQTINHAPNFSSSSNGGDSPSSSPSASAYPNDLRTANADHVIDSITLVQTRHGRFDASNKNLNDV